MGGFGFCNLRRGALEDDFPAVFSGFGADIWDPVGLGGDGHVVLDNDDGVAFVGEAVEDVDEASHVLKMEADGGFFEDGVSSR